MKTKIEFHEVGSRRRPMIEVQYHVEDLEKFIEWCLDGGDPDRALREFKWYLKNTQKSRAKRPHFKFYLKSRITKIYPKENTLTLLEGALHYTCQHSLDILPRKVWDGIYNSIEGIDEPKRIGTLVTKTGERFPVTDHDISIGFMLHSKASAEYNDSFVEWIKYRREINPFKEGV